MRRFFPNAWSECPGSGILGPNTVYSKIRRELGSAEQAPMRAGQKRHETPAKEVVVTLMWGPGRYQRCMSILRQLRRFPGYDLGFPLSRCEINAHLEVLQHYEPWKEREKKNARANCTIHFL